MLPPLLASKPAHPSAGDTGYSEDRPRIADTSRSTPLATPNYSYEKRQRELAKKKKNEEKRLRKLSGKPDDAPGDTDEQQPHDAAAAGDASAPAAAADDKA